MAFGSPSQLGTPTPTTGLPDGAIGKYNASTIYQFTVVNYYSHDPDIVEVIPFYTAMGTPFPTNTPLPDHYWIYAGYGLEAISGMGDCSTVAVATPIATASTGVPNVTPSQTLSQYGISFSGPTGYDTIVLAAVNDVATALHSMSAMKNTQSPSQVFQTIMGPSLTINIIPNAPSGNKGICVTDNNTATITCDDNLIAPDNSALPFDKYTIVHELGHVFDNKAAQNRKSSLSNRMSQGVVIADCIQAQPSRVMGELPTSQGPSSFWTRGERGWGSGPARLGTGVMRQVTNFQKNAVLIKFQIDPNAIEYQMLVNNGMAIPTSNNDPQGARQIRIEEAAADMFLNWVYRRNMQGPTPWNTPTSCISPSPSWNGPGFLNKSWASGIQPLVDQPAEMPGDARFAWMDFTLTTIFGDHGW